jgi:hypothetical protein
MRKRSMAVGTFARFLFGPLASQFGPVDGCRQAPVFLALTEDCD